MKKTVAVLSLTTVLAFGTPQPAQAELFTILSVAGTVFGLISNATSMAEKWGNNVPKYNEPRYADLEVPEYGLGRCDINNIMPDDYKRPSAQCTVNTVEGYKPLWFNVSQAQTQQMPVQVAHNSGCYMNNIQPDINGQPSVYCSSDGQRHVLLRQ